MNAKHLMPRAIGFASLLAAACSSDSPSESSGTEDADVRRCQHAGCQDAGSVDSGAGDAAPDSGVADAAPVDAAPVDAAKPDASDASMTPAADYYVSTSGSDNNPGTASAPFRTIAKADSVVKPGQVVYVLAGNYGGPVSLTQAGTAAARIRWVSPTRWGATVSDVSIGGDYVDFEGFDAVGGSSNVIISLTGNYTRVIGNHVHDLPTPCTGSNGGAAIDFDGGNANYQSHDQEAIGNFVENIGANPDDHNCSLVHGIYLAVPYGKAVNNLIRRVTGDGITSWHAATNLTIVNNTVLDSATGILIGNGDSGGSTTGNHDSFVANNVLVGNAQWAITECCDATYHGPNTYVNNLGWNNGYDVVGNIARGGTETGSIQADPLFVNAAAGDYHLSAGSPAVDRGTSTNAPATDFDGVARPVGGGFDLGAFERH